MWPRTGCASVRAGALPCLRALLAAVSLCHLVFVPPRLSAHPCAGACRCMSTPPPSQEYDHINALYIQNCEKFKSMQGPLEACAVSYVRVPLSRCVQAQRIIFCYPMLCLFPGVARLCVASRRAMAQPYCVSDAVLVDSIRVFAQLPTCGLCLQCVRA